MSTTITGPRSFKATIVPPRCTVKSHVSCVCEQPDTLTWDASEAVSKAEQRALFADYTATAKEHKLVARKTPESYGNLPKFTAASFTASERQFLGKAVGFRPGVGALFSPVAGGKADWSANMLHGTVWSLAPYVKAFWVYVEGQGFYAVREENLLTGVNA
jgi:hypothetical protein